MVIRPETRSDFGAISRVNLIAFRDNPYSQQTEHLIVEELRDAGALEISLVAEDEGVVVGHIAFSRAVVGEQCEGWFLLGPVAVLPEYQHRGVGSALVEAGLRELRTRGALGCVLVGDPGFYGRFGFAHLAGVTHEGVPDEYVLCLPLAGQPPTGAIHAHDAFSVGLEP